MNDTSPIDLGAVFDAHMAAEFVQHDADAAMATMTTEPYLTHVPVATGGFGGRALHDFYRDHFVTKWPADLSVERITRTQGDDILIDEFIVRFTHDIEMDAILPGVPPTGRRVELPHVAVVGFEHGKIAFERIYWDQGSLLAQIGLLDAARLPVVGPEQAPLVLDPRRARNALIDRTSGSD
ncbi:MAG TPA: ester cyclase [Acidimicrobiia bacterium]